MFQEQRDFDNAKNSQKSDKYGMFFNKNYQNHCGGQSAQSTEKVSKKEQQPKQTEILYNAIEPSLAKEKKPKKETTSASVTESERMKALQEFMKDCEGTKPAEDEVNEPSQEDMKKQLQQFIMEQFEMGNQVT
jgi:hypothetical protein